jgi:peptidyl-prolyl cis-trans isomerase D
MISSLRNKKKFTQAALWFIIAAFAGTIFFAWGVGDQVSESLYAAKVDGTIITDNDFRQKVDTTREQFRQLFGNNVDDFLTGDTLEKTVMETLINETLLRNEAARLSLPVSDAEVAMNVQNIQAFQTDGQFDQELYVQLLSRNRLTPQIFEESMRQDILLKKMEDLIKQSVAVSDAEIEAEYIYRNTQGSVRYLELAADDFVGKVQITDEAVAGFYEKFKEQYRRPERADFIYTIFSPADAESAVTASDAEVEQFFIKNKESLKEPESVNAAHILLKVSNWADENAANEIYKKAKDIREKIVGGAEFAGMAEIFSEDTTAENGGELGWFTKGQMVAEFEKAAFETKPGEVSDVVKTEYGFHIVKVNDYKPEVIPTLDDVREKLREMIVQQKKQNSFRSYVYDKYREILNKSNITAYNQDAETKLSVKAVSGVTANGGEGILANQPAVAAKLMLMQKSEISQVLDVNGEKIIFEMTEKYDSYIPELEAIKGTVTADFLKYESLLAAQSKAEEASKLATMDEAAEMLKMNYSTTPKFKRSEPITGIGLNDEMMKDIFASEAGQFIQKSYTVGGRVYVVQVKEIVKPDFKEADAGVRDQIRTELYGVKSTAAVQGYVNTLAAKAKISVNQRYSQFYK